MHLINAASSDTQVTDGAARSPRRVPGDSLAAVRVVVGLGATTSAVRLVAYGWIDTLVAGPVHRLTYPGLAWVPRPGHGLAIVLACCLALAGLAVAVGWRTRASAVVLLISFVWLELADATNYLNHYWFLTLLGVLVLVGPFAATWSLDSRRRGRRDIDPLWVLLVRAQVGVVYVFAAIAKMHTDWLVHAMPLHLWLEGHTDRAVVGPILAMPATAHVASVAGLLFDLTIVPLLCWRRTRLGAWCVLVGFHVATWYFFPIGVFPWVMIGASTIFFAPSWPRRFLRVDTSASAPISPKSDGSRRWLSLFVCAWIALQLLVPLRHWFVAGDARWTGEGYRLAWNVLAVESSGEVVFRVTDPTTGHTEVVDPHDLLTGSQLRVAATEPELIRQVAHIVAADSGIDQVEVRADAWVSFNGRAPARLVDPDVDLAAEGVAWGHREWILPSPVDSP